MTPPSAKLDEPPPAPGDATAVLPEGKVFVQLDTRSRRGRSESSQPRQVFLDKHVGRFELVRELARGGMGQVFIARDTKLGRKVAIKFLLRDDKTFVQRFLVEARATARCTHENIVTIYEVGEHDGLPYMVLELLEGKTLAEVLDGRPSLRQFIELMIPVARALDRAHEHGIVHRDLKPSNIFVTERGHVKVLDFGVARLVDPGDVPISTPRDEPIPREPDASSTFTGANSLVGTLPYMSPEQWGADVVDHQSDVWAFGIICWRALAGDHPLGSVPPEKLREYLCDLETPLPSIATRDATLPAKLIALVDRCLAKRKTARYQRASDLLADLQAVLAPKLERDRDDVCPYRGLAAYGEEDAKFFFGRSSEIRSALAQLEHGPLLAVIGPSGVGKSSFVHAGLIPAVKATGSWQVNVLRPGRSPLDRLAGVLGEVMATGEDNPELADQLADAPGMFAATLRAFAARKARKILVVVDQFEELFTLCDSETSRQLFLTALLAAADDSASPIRVVVSMRADFLDRIAGHKQFLGELSRGLFFLMSPDQDNLREVIERPAELAGHALEDGLVDEMLQVATSRGALPLLSFAATRLWDSRDRRRKMLTRSAYRDMGGVVGAFARHADQVAAAVPADQQVLLRAIMLRLVTPDGTRAVVDEDELRSLSDDVDEIEHILDQLVRARLIQLHSAPDQGATVEIVHETLITEWPMLRRWLDESHAIRGFVHELRTAARQWVTRGKPADLVWRGATAHEALAHARRNVLDLSQTEKEYLAAVERVVVRGRRRMVMIFASIAGVLALVLAGGAIALVQIRDAESDAKQQRDEALKAKNELQGKLDIIEAEKHARERVQRDLESSLSAKEQLEQANRELTLRMREAELAREQVQLADTAAKRAAAEVAATEARAREAAARERVAQAREAQKAPPSAPLPSPPPPPREDPEKAKRAVADDPYAVRDEPARTEPTLTISRDPIRESPPPPSPPRKRNPLDEPDPSEPGTAPHLE